MQVLFAIGLIALGVILGVGGVFAVDEILARWDARHAERHGFERFEFGRDYGRVVPPSRLTPESPAVRSERPTSAEDDLDDRGWSL